MTKYDLTNQRFGKLVVLEYIPGSRKLKKNGVWRCLCDCGKEVFTSRWKLEVGNHRSCGCATQRSPEQLLDAGIAQFLRSLKQRNTVVDLTKEAVKSLIFQNCTYCGAPPTQTIKVVGLKRKRIEAFKYNGLDRIDSSRGYFLENVLPCCLRCNVAKGSDSKEDFVIWLENLIQNFPV